MYNSAFPISGSRPLEVGEGVVFNTLDEAFQFLVRQREILPTPAIDLTLKRIPFAGTESYIVIRNK